MDPFRVVGFFVAEQTVCEWRWDVGELVCLRHEWLPRQWLSSVHDEPTAQRIRSETFTAVLGEADAGSVPWLRRLHASHAPAEGPFSTCMHRADAATVSYTEAEVDDPSAVLRHCAGPLCCGEALVEEALLRCGGKPRSSRGDEAQTSGG